MFKQCVLHAVLYIAGRSLLFSFMTGPLSLREDHPVVYGRSGLSWIYMTWCWMLIGSEWIGVTTAAADHDDDGDMMADATCMSMIYADNLSVWWVSTPAAMMSVYCAAWPDDALILSCMWSSPFIIFTHAVDGRPWLYSLQKCAKTLHTSAQ